MEAQRCGGQENIWCLVLSRRNRICSSLHWCSRSPHFFRRLQKIILVAFALTLSACGSSIPQGEGSILVISIPGFRADALNCGTSNDSITPQLDIICAESVRFTHAYTPSTLVNPALASVLTGLYPSEHGVHRNDASRYIEGVKSVPQWAAEMGRETFLISGGVPVLRKSAISKGFDDFDDSIREGGSFYRPADKVVKQFLNLLELRSAGGLPFFAVLQMADLFFPDIPSRKSNQLEGREGAYNGKLQEIDEAIGLIRSVFKRMRIWDQLTVVIVGLQGSERTEHDGLSNGINLYDEVVRVPLVVKPSRKSRDLSPSWKIDTPVTLVDLGVSLLKLLGVTDFKRSNFPVVDFLGALEGKAFPEDERPLFCESDLPAWRGWGPKLISMRFGEWVYWPGSEPKLFNTYTDRLELHNLFAKDYNTYQRLQNIWQKYSDLLLLQTTTEDTPKTLPYSMGEKLRVAHNIFSRFTTSEAKIRELEELEVRRADDWQILQWHVGILLEEKNWLQLHKLLSEHKPHTAQEKKDFKNWSALLDLHNMKIKNDSPTDTDLACLSLAAAFKRFSLEELEAFDNQKTCKDRETQAWIHAFVSYKQKRSKDASAFFEIAKTITDKRLEQIGFAKTFWIAGASWDFRASLPEGPSLFDMFLSLVSSQEFLDFAKRRQAL
jgi:hypothetical protein